jgi:hypothetical protein
MIMAKPELMVVRDSRIPALAMANRFSKYKPEEEKAVRKAEVVEDETLKQLKTIWRKARHDYYVDWGGPYWHISDMLKRLDYSASDVEKFSLILAEFQGQKHFYEKAGLFLSALINNGKDSDYVIHTLHLSVRIALLGYENTKNITVNGDLDHDVGLVMQSGSITVNGNVGDSCGNMMRGGTITIEGDAGREVGSKMVRGSIYLNGHYGTTSRQRGHGKIYHNGKEVGRS